MNLGQAEPQSPDVGSSTWREKPAAHWGCAHPTEEQNQQRMHCSSLEICSHQPHSTLGWPQLLLPAELKELTGRFWVYKLQL